MNGRVEKMNGRVEKMKIKFRFWEGKALIMGSVLGFDSGKEIDADIFEFIGSRTCMGGICGGGSRLWEGVFVGL
ncbi:MAG: hypothetical protein ABIH25_02130 [Candidatus Woesearchaeota archaeon]